MSVRTKTSRALWALVLCLVPMGVLALEKTVSLEQSDGQKIVIGTLQLPDSGEGGYRFQRDESVFESHFLSMRPFLCLSHPVHMLCHLPYLYKKSSHWSADAPLTLLEYDFLFIRRSPTEYGIDAWNGLYYKLEPTEKGWIGRAHETDLNVLASPPEAGIEFPIDPNEIYPAELEQMAYPILRIE